MYISIHTTIVTIVIIVINLMCNNHGRESHYHPLLMHTQTHKTMFFNQTKIIFKGQTISRNFRKFCYSEIFMYVRTYICTVNIPTYIIHTIHTYIYTYVYVYTYVRTHLLVHISMVLNQALYDCF